jgi:hypothetical protein
MAAGLRASCRMSTTPMPRKMPNGYRKMFAGTVNQKSSKQK